MDNLTFMLNATRMSINEFLRCTLNLYQTENLSAPNQAINILGIARAYSQLRYNNNAARIYRVLINQITATNISDSVFSQEAADYIMQKKILQNSAKTNHFCFSSIFVIILIFILH